MLYSAKDTLDGWGKTCRMGKGRIPKDLLYGKLEKSTRKTGCPILCYKDVCKRNIKSAAIDKKVGSLWSKIAPYGGIS